MLNENVLLSTIKTYSDKLEEHIKSDFPCYEKKNKFIIPITNYDPYNIEDVLKGFSIPYDCSLFREEVYLKIKNKGILLEYFTFEHDNRIIDNFHYDDEEIYIDIFLNDKYVNGDFIYCKDNLTLETNLTDDIVFYTIDRKILSQNMLPSDLTIKNSLTIGLENSDIIGKCSLSNGLGTEASGDYSHAEGCNSIALSNFQHVEGKYNKVDNKNKYAHIIGNGNNNNRSNAHTLDWNGNGWYAGKLSQEGTPTENKDLATKKYVDSKFNNLDGIILRDQTTGIDYIIQMDNGTLTSKIAPTGIDVDNNISLPISLLDGDRNYYNDIAMNIIYPDGTTEEILDIDSIKYHPEIITSDVTEITATYGAYGKVYEKKIPVIIQEFNPYTSLIDFYYTNNDDGTYTLTGWKGTYKGEPSTELIIPDNSHIIL